MLRFSEGINLGIHASSYLASHEGEAVTVATIAKALGVSKDHLSKVMQRLSKIGMVSAQRGPKGGYQLERDPSDVTLLEVVEALEGPWQHSYCLMGGAICGDACALHEMTANVYRQVREKLEGTTLADLPRLGR